LLEEFDTRLAALAVRSFTTAVANRLQLTKAAGEWPQLLELIAPKLTGRSDRDLLAAVRGFTCPLDQLHSVSVAMEKSPLMARWWSPVVAR